MSGSAEQIGVESDGEFKRYSDVAERIAKKTAPGVSNRYFVNSLSDASAVVDEVADDLNNWVEFVDVRLFRGNVMGIPCRYRWTIKRWVSNDMDTWLNKNGWNRLPHLKADSRSHKDNEMEARYYKEFDGWDVFVNIYVEFTEDVFEEMGDENEIGRKASEQDKDHIEAIREMKRSE